MDDIYGANRDVDDNWGADELGSEGRDERHFDDCEFNGSAEFINDRYDGARS